MPRGCMYIWRLPWGGVGQRTKGREIAWIWYWPWKGGSKFRLFSRRHMYTVPKEGVTRRRRRHQRSFRRHPRCMGVRGDDDSFGSSMQRLAVLAHYQLGRWTRPAELLEVLWYELATTLLEGYSLQSQLSMYIVPNYNKDDSDHSRDWSAATYIFDATASINEIPLDTTSGLTSWQGNFNEMIFKTRLPEWARGTKQGWNGAHCQKWD